jgi:hypothetical protein
MACANLHGNIGVSDVVFARSTNTARHLAPASHGACLFQAFSHHGVAGLDNFWAASHELSRVNQRHSLF